MKFSRDFVRTGGVGDFETTDLDRRSADSVRLHGRIKEVDYKRTPPAYRVEFGDAKDEDNYILTDWLPAGGNRAKGDTETHFLEVGEKVALLSEGGELSTGHVIPAGTFTENDDEKAGTDKAGVWHKKFKDGAEFSYDRESGALSFKAVKTVKIEGEGCSITLAGGKITLDGEVTTTKKTVLNNGTRKVVFEGSKDSDGDSNNEAADGVFV